MRRIPDPVTRISIIIPVFNESAVIESTLSSLQPFRKHGHEVLVVDGGSRDHTVRLAVAGADRVIHAPRGRALQMSAGVSAAQGDVILFLHADTLPHPQADDLILEAMSQGIWGRFAVKLSGRNPLLRLVERLMNLRSRITGIVTGDQGIFVRREALDAIGGVPCQALMEDIELSRRLKRLGRPVCLREQVVSSSRRWEEKGVVSTILLMWRLRLAYALGADPERLATRYYTDPVTNSGLLLIFAKAPVAGYAKRRLIPALGAEKAAALQARLIEQTLATAVAAGIPVELWCAPDVSHPFFAGCASRYPIILRSQAGRDLGERMHHAFMATLGCSPWALLIGCDSPALTPEMLIKSSRILEQGCDAVIGPAEDGGYYLIGLRRPNPSLFHDIPWGTGVVLEQTRERLHTLGWRWQELPPLWDLDLPDDLSRLGRTVF